MALAFFGDVVWPWHVLLLIVALAAAYVAMGQYGWLFFKALREKRREVRLCRRIQADIPRVSQQCQQAQAERQENLKNKEEHEHEYQR